LAVCCEMVEAPRRSPPFSAACIAFWISLMSNPSWVQKFWSSEAITARTRWGEISLRSTHFERTSTPFIAMPAMLKVGAAGPADCEDGEQAQPEEAATENAGPYEEADKDAAPERLLIVIGRALRRDARAPAAENAAAATTSCRRREHPLRSRARQARSRLRASGPASHSSHTAVSASVGRRSLHVTSNMSGARIPSAQTDAPRTKGDASSSLWIHKSALARDPEFPDRNHDISHKTVASYAFDGRSGEDFTETCVIETRQIGQKRGGRAPQRG